MGTRSLTVFTDSNKEIVVMYRQFDGYLEGHGKELADFLKNKTIVNGISGDENMIFNGMGCLTASVVAKFKEGVGEIYLHPAGTRGQEYTYFVSGKVGEEPHIKIQDFDGPASEYQEWLDESEEERR